MEATAFPRHEQYKPALSAWLGEVPSHWSLLPGLAVLRENKKKNIGMVEETVLSLSYGTVIIKPPEKLTGLVPESFETYQVIKPNDIIIRPTDLQNDHTSLRTGLAKDHGIITSAYICLRPSPEHNPVFMHYLLHAYDLMKVFYGMGSGLRQNLDYRDFKRLELCFPHREEQDRIANFLDQKTAEIDEAIAKKQRLIELLKEQKAILINQAVTKGLNPDVAMRDSGVEWIGEVPEHWNVSKLSHYARITNGSTPSRDVPGYWLDGTIPWLSSGKVNEYEIYTPSELVTKRALKETSIRIYPKGTVVIGIVGQGKTRGTSAIMRLDACINQNMAAIETERCVDEEYVHRYLVQAYDHVRNYGKGSNQEALNCELVGAIKMTFPPLEEQQTIVIHIKSIEDKIDKIIRATAKENELLSELKINLISEAVTGKVKL
ncbi:MAG: restriction endonuclease subunit S [Candidatus Thiodiazotropha sp.]|nr:restriction endonuclease subunit S [Candidatus Thiodiazotropha sp.]MCM8883418.1 restriction endonuclease subunit S [Candidatus Thiodiazotropha sp.]MCM8919137.1 restriction endonuclease subunit S [Candidatus Thiodiazotropha sp.]